MNKHHLALVAATAAVALPGTAVAAPTSVEAVARLTVQAHADTQQAAALAARARRTGDGARAAAQRANARAMAVLQRSRSRIAAAASGARRLAADAPASVAAEASATFSSALVRDTRDLAGVVRAQGAAGRAAAQAIGVDAQLRVAVTSALLARAVDEASAAPAASQAAVAAHSDDLDAAAVLARRLREESDAGMRSVLRRAAVVQLSARSALEQAARRLADSGSVQAQGAHEDVADGTVVEARLFVAADGTSADGSRSSAGDPTLVELAAHVTVGLRR